MSKPRRLFAQQSPHLPLLLAVGALLAAPALAGELEPNTPSQKCVYVSDGGDLVVVASQRCLKGVREDEARRKALAAAIAQVADQNTPGTGRDLHPLQRLSLRSHWGRETARP